MSSQFVIRRSVHLNLFGVILAPIAKLSPWSLLLLKPNTLSCFHTKPKKHFNAATAGQVKLNCLHPKPMLDVPPAQRMEKWKRLVVFIDAAEGRVAVSRCADRAPLLGARWRMHTGGRCTWPSAISADTLIYHPQPWIIVLLSLSPDASAQPEKKRKNGRSVLWFQVMANRTSLAFLALPPRLSKPYHAHKCTSISFVSSIFYIMRLYLAAPSDKKPLHLRLISVV